MKKIYIIGTIPSSIDFGCIAKFYRVQMSLAQLGFLVINPIERYVDKNYTYEEAVRKNMQDFTMADAVYIMPCVSLEKGNKNFELKWAIDFNLIIFNGMLDVNSIEQEVDSRRRETA